MSKEPEQVWADERAAAMATLRKLKKEQPEAFEQWHCLMRAKEVAREANADLARAQAAWDAIGED